jgi:aspartate dehydrogenase
MKVGIAGLGTIGTVVARALDAGIDGLSLDAVAARDHDKARRRMESFRKVAPVVSADELAERVDVVCECVPKAAFREIAEPALSRGRVLITVSGAALLDAPDLVDLARRSGGRILLATGAILGLDALRAAAEGEIESVTMVTRKPPRSLRGAPYLQDHNINIDSLDEPLRVFEGSAEEGAQGFPSNVNVAAAIGLAGVGAARTRLEIWADPGAERNMHTVRVEADSARFEMSIENVPSDENPGTGKLTALSVIATLRGLVSPLKVGT